MFFVLSKILNVLFSPLIWIFFLGIASILMKKRFRKPLQLVAVFVLLFFSNNAIFQIVIRSWEPVTISPEVLLEEHRTIVVLGGMISENEHNGLPRFAQSSDRFWQAFYLLKTGFADSLLISGGLGTLFDDQCPEGELWKDYLKKTGLLNDKIFFESSSRNTYENAVKSAAVFENRRWTKKIILVTSGFHVPRAKACFEKQGFEVAVFPADPVANTRPLQWKDYLMPSAGVMESWGLLLREWGGWIMYKLNGYI